MNEFMLRLLLFVMGIGYTIFGSAQNKLSGRILDEHKQGIDAAVVMLVSLPDSILVETKLTDSNGQFSFSLQKRKFILCVRALGYQEIRQNFTPTSSNNLPDIQMVPDEFILKDVVITARKSRSMVVSSNGKIQIHVAQSYLTDIGNALDVLKSSPGISVNNKGEISLATLGGTAIYINGKKLMLQGEELSSYLRTLSSSNISRIETSPSPDASFSADGAGGIINIVLKTSERLGWLLNTTQGVAYWENLKQNSDIALSYNTNKWQLGFNYNHSMGYHAMSYGYEKILNGDKSLSETVDTDKRNTYSAGIDFSLCSNKKHKLFLNSTINLLTGPGETQTTTHIYRTIDKLEGILKARNNYIEQRAIRYNNSINYLFQPSEKHQLSLSVDWTHFDGLSRCEQPNDYYSATNSLVRSDFFYSQPDRKIDIYALLADYKYNPNERNKLLAGIKASFIKSDNVFLFRKNGILDWQRSNVFYYDEKNVEGYTQYTYSWDKWNLSAGLRMEYMCTHNKLDDYNYKNTEENNHNNLRLFPNLNIVYMINENNKIALLYSRRQDKPRYEDLNPFEYLLDELSYWKGNPFLKPQISNKIMLNYTWKSLLLNLYYNKLDDYFTSLTDVFENSKMIMTTKNIGTQKQVGLEATFSKCLAHRWNLSTNIGFYYFVNKLDYETYRILYKRPSCFFSVSNSILLPLGISFELSGRYYSRRQGGSYEVNKPTGCVDLGFNKSWCNGQMRLSLLMTDALHSERWDNYGVKDALNLSSWGYGESRKIILRYSYIFRQQKLDRTMKNIEELNRL